MSLSAWLLVGVIVVVVIGVGIWFSTRPAVAPTVPPLSTDAASEGTPKVVAPPQLPTAQKVAPPSPVSFQIETFTAARTPHFVSSEPANNAALTTAPENVTITFNFDVVPPSKIMVSQDGVDVASGATVIAADKLSMSVPVTAEQTGNYQVTYAVCWPDQSCHNGSFGFSVQLAP